jgi:hypothetical protein
MLANVLINKEALNCGKVFETTLKNSKLEIIFTKIVVVFV